MRRPVAAALLLASAGALPALADTYADLGQPEQCGTYAEASYDRGSYFPGGEGGLFGLTDAQSVRGLNAVLFDAILTEEGLDEPAGRVLAARGPLIGQGNPAGTEVLVIVTEDGIRILQRCP